MERGPDPGPLAPGRGLSSISAGQKCLNADIRRRRNLAVVVVVSSRKTSRGGSLDTALSAREDSSTESRQLMHVGSERNVLLLSDINSARIERDNRRNGREATVP